jgi:hypothetical protein
MASAGIEIRYDRKAFDALLEALSKAAKPDRLALSRFMGAELEVISNETFEREDDPVTGDKWAPLTAPRGNGDTVEPVRFFV